MDDIIIIELFLQLMLSVVTLTPRTPAYPSRGTRVRPFFKVFRAQPCTGRSH